MIKFLFSWKGALAAFVIFFLITSPTTAASKVHSGLEGLQSAGQSLTVFFNAL